MEGDSSMQTPRARPSYMSIRSHKKYGPTKFLEDLQLVPFHMVNYFDYISDQVYMYGILFLDVLNEHAPIKRIKIKVKPNPFVSPEIKQLMKTRDNRPFLNYLWPLFQSESWCSSFHMKISFHSHANEK